MPLHLNRLPVPKISFKNNVHSPLLLDSSDDDSDDDKSSLPLKEKARRISDKEKQRRECELYMEQIDKQLKDIHAGRLKRATARKKRNRRRKSGYEIKKESIEQMIQGKEKEAIEQRKDDIHLASVQLEQGFYTTGKRRNASPQERWSKRRKDPPPPPSPIKTADPSLTQDSGSSIRSGRTTSTRSSRMSNGTEHSLLSQPHRYPEEATFDEIGHKRGTLISTYGSPCIGCGKARCPHMKALMTTKEKALKYFSPRPHKTFQEIELNSKRRNWFYTAFKQHVGLTSIKLSPYCVCDFATRWFPPSINDRLRRIDRKHKNKVASQQSGEDLYCANSLLQLTNGTPSPPLRKRIDTAQFSAITKMRAI